MDIVIVNWNSGTQLRDCLVSVGNADSEGSIVGKIIVVDNGSTDRSHEIPDDTGLPIHIIENCSNMGFAKACNQGARYGNSRTILFLNPDMTLFKQSLRVPKDFLERTENKGIGIVGIQLVNEAGEITSTCAHFPTVHSIFYQILGLDRLFSNHMSGHFLKEREHTETRPVDKVMGAFFMVRRKLFEDLNGFDERFFMYYEALDFSLRARNLGYSSWFIADAAAYHRGCGSSDTVLAERLFYLLKSRTQYGFKHFGDVKGTLLFLTTLVCEPIVRCSHAFLRRSKREFFDTLKGLLMLYKWVHNITGKKNPVKIDSYI